MEREGMYNESFCTRSNLLIETSAEEIPTVALREAELEYQNESYQYSVFDYIGPSGLRCKEANELFGNQVTCYE